MQLCQHLYGSMVERILDSSLSALEGHEFAEIHHRKRSPCFPRTHTRSLPPCDCTAGLRPRKYFVFWINCALLHEKPCLRHLVMSAHTNTQNLEMAIHLTWQHKALGPENLRITTLETRGKKEAKVLPCFCGRFKIP